MYRILIADDETSLRQAVVKYAKFHGYDTYEASDGAAALELCRKECFDLILLDVMMPGMDGVSACREIRRLCDTPILMLTALGEEYDKIAGFEAGADDYVVKPFSPKELMLRIAAILKRADKAPPEADDLRYGGVAVSAQGRWLEVDGVRVGLTGREFDLLYYLASRPGVAVSRRELISELWGGAPDEAGRTLDTHIKQLRKALGPYSRYIVTLRGVGYRFEETQEHNLVDND